MRYVKMMIAGMALPSFIIPFLLLFAAALGKSQVFTITFSHFIPLIWGIWNALYFAVFSKFFSESGGIVGLSVMGGVLGLLIAIYGVFWLQVPHLMGVPESMNYIPLIAGPILYAVLWGFIVKPLNDLLGI